MNAKRSLADEVAGLQESPENDMENRDNKEDRDSQLTGLAKIDEALKRMGIPLVEPYRRPLSTRIKRSA